MDDLFIFFCYTSNWVSTMEKRDLYNENKELTGKTIYKNEEIPEGYFILMVVAFIENNEIGRASCRERV